MVKEVFQERFWCHHWRTDCSMWGQHLWSSWKEVSTVFRSESGMQWQRLYSSCYPFEVGCRGFVADSLQKYLRDLGLNRQPVGQYQRPQNQDHHGCGKVHSEIEEWRFDRLMCIPSFSKQVYNRYFQQFTSKSSPVGSGVYTAGPSPRGSIDC